MAINPFQQFNSPSMSLLNVGGFQDPLQPKPIGQDIVNVPQLQNQVGQLQARKNQQLGSMLLALGDIFRGQDPATGVMQRQMFFQQQTAKEEEKQRQERIKQFVQQNPKYAQMYELFGEKGVQSSYISQLEAQQEESQRQSLISNLQKSGVSKEDASLIALGLSPDDIDALKQEETTSQKIISNVEKEVNQVAETTKYADAYSNLPEAFGPIDATQEGINRFTRAVFGGDIAGETGAAIRARDNLNLEILANLAADFTGRPNMLIYEEIKNILPTSSLTSEKDAYEKYSNILQRTKSRIASLKQGLSSETISDANKEKYRDELFKSLELAKKLDAAVLSLDPKEISLDPEENFISEGKFSYLYKD